MDYYFSPTVYDEGISTPKSVLGYQIGEFHISHDQIRIYVDRIARESDRVLVEEIGRTYEMRPLQNIYISTPKNLSKLKEFQEAYQLLSNPKTCDQVDIENLPSIIYQGYSIHGNESSGSNAAMLMLYHLAAGQSEEVMETLENTIIIMDPCMNPDGFNRFASWVNSNRSQNLNGDKYIRELNEPWPRGRTNHYWFDLNRDWLLLTHPESRARVRQYHKFKPLILTDHHEMGTNRTFFFQPGIPSRTNPITPQKNQDITGQIGRYHAAGLDEIGSLYYTRASYDDYYYGKGSTYPDGNGSIGILFEQASSRGHLQESRNGPLSFPFTIRNQVVTSITTQQAAVKMRKKLLEYRRWFVKESQKEARASNLAGYVFTDQDEVKLNTFVDILLQHDLEVFTLNKDYNTNGLQYPKENAYYIPLEQSQYKMVKTIFEKVNSFPDSLFYDVSAWTMPLAFDLQHDEVSKNGPKVSTHGQAITEAPVAKGEFKDTDSPYAYLIDWTCYYSPALLYDLLSKDLRVKVLQKEVRVQEGELLGKGTLVIPIQNQNIEIEDLRHLLRKYQNKGVHIHAIETGVTQDEFTLGDPSVADLKRPKILLVSGDGAGYADVGEMWHQMDVRYQMPISVVDGKNVGPDMLDRYNTIILAHAQPSFNSKTITALKDWVKEGGSIVATKRSINWLNGQGMIQLKPRPIYGKGKSGNSYDKVSTVSGSRVLGGAILEGKMDMTHPLTYGYADENIALFRRGTSFYEPTANPHASPIRYTDQPILSGYVPRGMEATIAGSTAISVHKSGNGTIICLQDSPVFRGYWYGGHRLLANSIFFKDIINRQAKQ